MYSCLVHDNYDNQYINILCAPRVYVYIAHQKWKLKDERDYCPWERERGVALMKHIPTEVNADQKVPVEGRGIADSTARVYMANLCGAF